MAPRPRFPYWPGATGSNYGPKIRLQSRPQAVDLLAVLRSETQLCRAIKNIAYLREESRYEWLGGEPSQVRLASASI